MSLNTTHVRRWNLLYFTHWRECARILYQQRSYISIPAQKSLAQVPLCYQYKYTSIKKMKKQPTCKPNVFSTKFSVITVKECLHYSDKFCTVKLLVLHIKMAKNWNGLRFLQVSSQWCGVIAALDVVWCIQSAGLKQVAFGYFKRVCSVRDWICGAHGLLLLCPGYK